MPLVWLQAAVAASKTPRLRAGGLELQRLNRLGSAEAQLGEDALAGEQFGGQANHKAEHGQAAIPGFGEADEAEARGVVSHGRQREETLQAM